MKVLIAGAGIGGLTTALRLHHEGIDCAVYEQADQIRELGVGINLLPQAVAELAELGLLEELADAGIRTHELIYAHRLGAEISRMPCGTAAGFTMPQISVHRGRLQGLLYRAVEARLGAGTVRTGRRLTEFDQDGDGVCAVFGGESVLGEVLVGADGIHSAVRETFFPAEGPPRWNGVMLWRGVTDWPEFGTGRSEIIAGGLLKLVIYPIAAGRMPGTKLTNWAMCITSGDAGGPPPVRQEWAKLANPADLRQYFDHFHVPDVDHRELILATEQIFEFPMCDRDPAPYWTRHRVTLLGDAAHPMYPMGSNGAGQAILDARSLADHLARHADPASALRAYELERLPATSEVVLRNRVGGPEQVIDVVEDLAPDGFDRLEDVVDPARLEEIVAEYLSLSGANRAR
ncbi:MAG TPA: flavin-dependent oxidoreductase [Actinophytocola sp.]|jgi:2-polyprenyl-6-methoxyphenol hydroxylase-like FAD-dependent oxidoreductase|uniref:flavin-dependent oxidoreductase n=1 Tax=Actinophytocola sp. TaxID=1872138 RepID=UPI002F955388